MRYQDDQVTIHLPEKFLSTAGLFHISREIDLYVEHHFFHKYSVPYKKVDNQSIKEL